MGFGIKINATDILFSKWIKIRDKFRCQRCGRLYQEGDRGLQCAHCFGRRVKATRWRDTNACALCTGCHSVVDSNPEEKRELFIRLFGEREYKTNRALHDLRTRTKVDEKVLRKELRTKLL